MSSTEAGQHEGVMMTGRDGPDGPKAFYIAIEARPGKQAEVMEMLRDIHRCVEDEPATAPWYALQHSETRFAIFEAFPDIAGRDAHVAGGGGDIFRSLERMNDILARPAQVQKVDVLMSKPVSLVTGRNRSSAVQLAAMRPVSRHSGSEGEPRG